MLPYKIKPIEERKCSILYECFRDVTMINACMHLSLDGCYIVNVKTPLY